VARGPQELKKARAALRLLRDVLGTSTYKKENAALRTPPDR